MTRPTSLLFIRHARPDSSAPHNPPLSEEGKVFHRRVTEHLFSRGVPIEFLYTSPLQRALETAEIVAEQYGCPLEVCSELIGENFEETLRFVQEKGAGKKCAFVGHAPTMRDLAAQLARDPVPYGIAKSGVFSVTFTGDVLLGKGEFIDFSLPADHSI